MTFPASAATIRGMGMHKEESTQRWHIRRAMQVCRGVLRIHMDEIAEAPPGTWDLVPMASYMHALRFAYEQCGAVIRSQKSIVRNLHETKSGPYVPKRKRKRIVRSS